MQVSRGPNHPALQPFVAGLGYSESRGPAVRERSIPSGCAQLLVNLHVDAFTDGGGGAAFLGATSRPSVIDTADQRAIAWVAFKPGGAFPFFPAESGLVDLGDVWGRAGAVVRERLLEVNGPGQILDALEAVLLEAGDLGRDRALETAVSALDRGVAVGDVAEQLGFTRKRLIGLFHDRVGLTPKRFGRVRRFQRTLARIPYEGPVDWADLAFSSGYVDQSHLIRDFHDFAGLRPTEYRPRSPGMVNHVPL
ncbi:helix-turn-helix domain-containing protein [Actinomadura barringtoniae]|uniref:Helix-turn-helix domain-containing protein n=1 Tax=Actinomadura barringtoniae TaxID=1427535 RepID=A0A939PI21_9ACTN|nr:helix-turn-helix domain-containing protein [Actinomadura barringtoniae]MBO2452840.1 helix-turn-helix domain-containing protein [Actinomadura barringtoniae]